MSSTLRSLRAALTSPRIAAVTLLSLSSGLPYGLVVVALPAWLSQAGYDVKTIGLITAVQAPYAFKFVWSPLMDRWHPPGPGRKRGWVLLAQLLLIPSVVALALQADQPVVGVVVALALVAAFVSASQDIAIDGYAVEVLDEKEQGLAVGARTALYLFGMLLAGKLAISIAARIGWTLTIALPAALYAVLALVTWKAPEPAVQAPPPRTLKEAVWEPLTGFLRQHRALEIAAFLVLFKLADNLAGSLVSPFLLEKGYTPDDVGVATATIGLATTLAGTFLGGVLTNALGLGRALWVFGALQALSNVGYALIASAEVSRPLMYGAIAVEHVTSGMGTGAFGVLLLRLTARRFSATQFALFSSLFALGRTVSGPVAGILVDAMGWGPFFYSTIFAAIPGLVMLRRFVPLSSRELPPLEEESPALTGPITQRGIVVRGVVGTAVGLALALSSSALLRALKTARSGLGFRPFDELIALLSPVDGDGWLSLAGPVLLGVFLGLGAAAYAAARRGPGQVPDRPSTDAVA